MIRTENLVFEYIRRDEEGNVEGITRAVDDVNLDIKPGQFIAILGHNGSGKSTLAKHFNALLYPTEGEVFVDGMNTEDDNNIWNIRQEAGMVFQNPDNQIVSNVVEEDVAFAPENLGVPTDEIRRRVDAALNTVGMYEYREHAPHLLSGGQKQRIAIAGVLAMQPECIVLEEPTAMLDPKGREEVVETISRLNREQGMTVVLITHHMSEAIGADRILVMHEGGVLLDGLPKEVFSQVQTLRDAGLDVPQTTELLYELNRSGWDLLLDALSAEDCADAILNALQKQAD